MKNKKYVPVKLRKSIQKYNTLLLLHKANKITPEQLDELVQISQYLISELIIDLTKSKKQGLVDYNLINQLSGI